MWSAELQDKREEGGACAEVKPGRSCHCLGSLENTGPRETTDPGTPGDKDTQTERQRDKETERETEKQQHV